jgi:hypothetical protein
LDISDLTALLSSSDCGPTIGDAPRILFVDVTHSLSADRPFTGAVAMNGRVHRLGFYWVADVVQKKSPAQLIQLCAQG